MEKYKKKLIILSFTLLFLFNSCVTEKNCIKKSNLSGIVIDENNRPVSNYKVICHLNSLKSIAAYTNNSGIFVLPNLETGNYSFSGLKENYGRINKKSFCFNGSASMFCCQVSSIKELICNADLLIENKEYEKAIEIINQIMVTEDNYNYVLVLLYKIYLYKKINKMDAYAESVRLLKKCIEGKKINFIQKGDMDI